MEPSISVAYTDLLDAFEWVSAKADLENAAFICRRTGATYFTSSAMDLGEEIPSDIDDGNLYIAVPPKTDLTLGRELAIGFAAEHLPDSYDEVIGYFRQRGAYGRFKELLERKDSLVAWYEYEAQAIERALRDWCRENEIEPK